MSPSTLSTRNPTLAAKVAQLAARLSPFVHVTTGQIHPDFPPTLLNYWLLTSDQLDALAHFYHQRTPCHWSNKYPCPVQWDIHSRTEDKRRRFGRFIGLNGCQSPLKLKSEEEIIEEARDARLNDDLLMRKSYGRY